MLSLFVFVSCQQLVSLPTVKITEFSSSVGRGDGGGHVDNFGEPSDWIELCNIGSQRLKLDGISISDNEQQPMKWQLPYITLEPQERLLIYASGRDISEAGSPLHTNFRISSSGEALLVTSREGLILDNISPTKMWTNLSYGRERNNQPDLERGSQTTTLRQ